WEAMKTSPDILFPPTSPFAFPPDPSTIDISKSIIALWKSLDPMALFEWEELTRDIQNAYAQLVARFGNGVVFYGDTWEYQRYYHAQSLFSKWMGYQYQSAHDTDSLTTVYAPASLTQT
ncbi:9217_t:CDS:1, partial [Acaulospora colombiana]